MKLNFVAFFLIIPTFLFGQANYQKGFVIKNSGDTLKGYIDYREWSLSPLEISFKLKKDDREAIQFDPRTIGGFEISGMEAYLSYRGPVSMNKTTFPDLPSKLDTSKMIDSIFMRLVTKGKYLSLYYQKDRRKIRFFIEEYDGKPMELNYSQFYQNNHDLVINTSYRNFLIYYIKKYAPANNDLIRRAQLAEYSEAGLESVVNGINGEAALNKNKAATRFFAGGGINIINIQELASFKSYYTSSVSPTLNAGIDVFVNPNIQQLILRAQVSFWYINSNIPNYASARFQQVNASITPQILYNFYNSDKLKFYIDAGWNFNFSTISTSGINSQGYLGPSGAAWTNFPLQIGVIINKKLDLSLQYTGYSDLVDYSNFTLANKVLGIGIRYFIPNK